MWGSLYKRSFRISYFIWPFSYSPIQIMAAMVLPFILVLMRPVPYYLEEIIGGKYYPSTLTPISWTSDDNPNLIKFSTKVGQTLPGSYSIVGIIITINIYIWMFHSLHISSVPLYAELEQSMTNEVKIYQQSKVIDSSQIKKFYYYSRNCDDNMLDFTEVHYYNNIIYY